MTDVQHPEHQTGAPETAVDAKIDNLDTLSITSDGSETSISTVISTSTQNNCSNNSREEEQVETHIEEASEPAEPSSDATDTVETTSIDWEALGAIEKRMVSEEEEIALFTDRLAHVKAEDCEECHLPVLSVSKLKEIVSTSSNLPFNDIPNIPSINYDDAELSLWSALLAEYRQVVEKIPKYASMMVRSGIPPALRGLAWKSMAEAATPTLSSLYDSLAAEWTPFVKIISRDLNRTFPEIKMFREKGGDGQQKLGRVLRAYSAYDMQVGYCQGLTFLTGPLLLHMDDKDAFCVLVKLMEDYELRSMFTADMSGLQLRMYQFESLFELNFPTLYTHFTTIGVNNIYASQWFLSFFAVTCPLGMLVRIFDLSFAEGAVPTLMRVALAVMKRNEQVLLGFEDEEQILQHMLGRSLWDSYALDADLLITDVVGFTSCTTEKLQELADEAALGKTTHTKRAAQKKTEDSQASMLAPFSSFPFAFRWYSATPPIPSEPPKKDTESIAESGMSVASYEGELTNPSLATDRLKSYQSSTSSLLSTEHRASAAKTAAFAAAEQQALKDQIASLSAEVETLKFELQNRERMEQAASGSASMSENKEGDDAEADSACCEQLRMELTLAKTSEVLARQEIEQLKHALHTAALNGSAQDGAAAPATEAEAPKPEAAKGWSLWG